MLNNFRNFGLHGLCVFACLVYLTLHEATIVVIVAVVDVVVIVAVAINIVVVIVVALLIVVDSIIFSCGQFSIISPFFNPSLSDISNYFITLSNHDFGLHGNNIFPFILMP